MTALFLRPDADQSDGSWLNEAASNTNLFNSVDEATTPSDTDFIKSSSTSGDKVRLRLSDPGTTVTAPMIVRYRCKKDGPAATNVIGRLFQGTAPGTQIATWTQLLTTTFTTYTYTLTTPEFSSISDFNDLYVEFEYNTDWWLPGASIDLWFAGGLYYDSSAGGSGQAVTSYLSCARASAGTAKDSGGNWVPFSANQLRITDLGLTVEDSKTNNLLNSAAPATQTTASLGTGNYTLWVEGSGSALASGGSATITGAASATAGSPDTFAVTVAGTVTVTVTGSLTRFQLEEGTYPTSFIITTGAALTRATDAIKCAGNADTILITLPHTSVVNIIALVSPTAQTILGDDTDGPVDLYTNSENNRVGSFMAGTGLASSVFPTSLFTTGAKVGTAVATSARSVAGDGGTVSPDTNAAAGLTGFIYLGSGAPSFRSWNGSIRRLTIWNSKLADATLQALTAP